MKFLWSVAWRNLWRQKRRSLITAVAMAIGVAMCMAMIAWSDGIYTDMFGLMVEQKLGHAQVHHPDYPAKHLVYDTVTERDALVARLEGMPGTTAVSPMIVGYGLLGGETKSTGGMVVGIDPTRNRAVSPLQERIREGRYLADEPAAEIIVGFKLAEDIGVTLGDEVVAVTQAADGSVGNALYTVVGTYKIGDMAMDNAGGYVHLADAEELFVLSDQAHRITLLTSHHDDIEAYTTAVRQAIGSEDIEVQSWWEVSPQTAELMGLKDVTTLFMLGIVFAVAAFGVINTMMMSVFERTREMGVLRALGLRPMRLVSLVVLESFFLACLASAIGLTLGGAIDWYLVVYGLDFTASMPDGMEFEGIVIDPIMRGEVRFWPILATVFSVFAVSLLAALYPAWRAAMIQPVEAIRTE